MTSRPTTTSGEPRTWIMRHRDKSARPESTCAAREKVVAQMRGTPSQRTKRFTGELLMKLRGTLGLSRSELARKAAISPGSLTLWEDGTSGMTLHSLRSLVQSLGYELEIRVVRVGEAPE